MMLHRSPGPLLFLALASPLTAAWTDCQDRATYANLTVTTRTGTFVGSLNDTYPDVRQFKYVPYAKPPIGDLRWQPPQSLADSDETIDSTTFGPACPQWVSANPSVYNNITGLKTFNYGQSLTAGAAALGSDEDCLSLGVWTPASATPDSALPVIIFLTGGGDTAGGVYEAGQLPSNWVHRSQKHIVVTTNYRLGILGFPNTPLLSDTNLGFQDARAAVQWVHENIAAFGGDPEKITLWGQSAGSISTDIYQFAYPNDPIVRATVSSSGFAIPDPKQGIAYDFQGLNFSFVAKGVGCDYCDDEATVQCMRRVSWYRLITFVGQYGDAGTKPSLAFTHQADGKYVFSKQDYIDRYADGRVARLPKIIGTCAREGSSLNNASAPTYEADLTSHTVGIVCSAHNTTVARYNGGLPPTWRYLYAGNWTDTTAGIPYLGAYHTSDLWMFFGTYNVLPRGPKTDFEIKTSEAMQDHLASFVQDPYSLGAGGWPPQDPYSSGGGKLALFGANGQAVQIVDSDKYEDVCHVPGATYDTHI